MILSASQHQGLGSNQVVFNEAGRVKLDGGTTYTFSIVRFIPSGIIFGDDESFARSCCVLSLDVPNTLHREHPSRSD